jgi:hypothetical protein
MFRATVPETAVYKNGNALLHKDEIGLPEQARMTTPAFYSMTP